MPIDISQNQAQFIKQQLLNFPVAPGVYSHFINAGTDRILDILEENYFRSELAQGISCFKYLQGDYGTGKTQFINCLAERAHRNGIVPTIVNIGQECPFNSPLAIYRSLMGGFLPPTRHEGTLQSYPEKGIEILIHEWIKQKLRELGSGDGREVPDVVRRQAERTFTQLWLGAPDTQAASALNALGQRLLDMECGAHHSVTDKDLISWTRGDNIRSKALKEEYGLHEPARDETAFKRLKAVIGFLRTRMSYRGFMIAFDEGTRTASFRRGSVKQKQAIENMLTMINENAEGEFGGVMFLYAATPDFRSEIISKYSALYDRIGTVAFLPGRPMTPLIELESLNTDDVIKEIGERLMDVYARASGVVWEKEIQLKNMETLIQAQKDVEIFLGTVPPRHFVYQYCRFLMEQEKSQRLVNAEDAELFVQTHKLPDKEE